MRAVVQRVLSASVDVVDGGTVTPRSALSRPGLLVLVGVAPGDAAAVADRLADKIAGLRILDDLSAVDVGAPVLVVSQFTLYADTSRGRRPSWSPAAPAEQAEPLVTAVAEGLRSRGLAVETGAFGAHMIVTSVNDGPMTVLLEVD